MKTWIISILGLLTVIFFGLFLLKNSVAKRAEDEKTSALTQTFNAKEKLVIVDSIAQAEGDRADALAEELKAEKEKGVDSTQWKNGYAEAGSDYTEKLSSATEELKSSQAVVADLQTKLAEAAKVKPGKSQAATLIAETKPETIKGDKAQRGKLVVDAKGEYHIFESEKEKLEKWVPKGEPRGFDHW